MAAALQGGHIADVTAVETTDGGDAVLTRPLYAGKAFERRKLLEGAPLTRDQWRMLQRDNVAEGPGLEAFGIRPTPFGAVAPEWLGMYGGNRFARRRVNITAMH